MTVTETFAVAVCAVLPVPSVAVAVKVTVVGLVMRVAGAVHVDCVPAVCVSVAGEKLPTAGFAVSATDAWPSPPVTLHARFVVPFTSTVVDEGAESEIASWTMTAAEAVALPPAPVVVTVYVVLTLGETVTEPLQVTDCDTPLPLLIAHELAFVLVIESVDEAPLATSVGEADTVTVGAAGGGGGGVLFPDPLLHPAAASKSVSAQIPAAYVGTILRI